MEQSAAEWRYAQLHEKKPYHDGTFESWSEKQSLKHPYHYSAGVRIWVAETDLAPHDHFLGGKSECPECSSGGGAVDREEDDSGDDQP